MSRTSQIAGIMADLHIRKFGMQKSLGYREQLIREYLPAAQLAARMAKKIDRHQRGLDEFRQANKRFRRYRKENDGRLTSLAALCEPAGNPEVPDFHPEALWAGAPAGRRARRQTRSITPPTREHSRQSPTRAISSSQARL